MQQVGKNKIGHLVIKNIILPGWAHCCFFLNWAAIYAIVNLSGKNHLTT